MSDLIDRKVAMKAIYNCNNIELNGKGEALYKLIKVPSAETERKKGKWIEHNPHKWGLGIVFECSECGETIECEPSNFCPHCGADMRGEE